MKTRAVSRKEKVFGHLIGPLGMIFIVNTIAALVEKFFMQMVGLTYPTGPDGTANPMAAALGNDYQLVMMIIKFVVIGVSVLNSWLLTHTKCRQGRLQLSDDHHRRSHFPLLAQHHGGSLLGVLLHSACLL